MLTFLWVAATGWIAIFFLVLVSALPFALRRVGAGGLAKFRAMRVHYFLGFAIPAFAAAHSFSTMSRLRGINEIGLWLAVAALTGLVVQVMLGTELRAPPWGEPRRLRRWHLVMMITTSGLIAGHVVLNRA